jgi:hypothetical protein
MSSSPSSSSPAWGATVLAGGLSGMTVDLVLFPLDSIKTYLQTRREVQNQSKLFGQGAARFYRGMSSGKERAVGG